MKHIGMIVVFSLGVWAVLVGSVAMGFEDKLEAGAFILFLGVTLLGFGYVAVHRDMKESKKDEFDVWYKENEDELIAKFAETGMDREAGFDFDQAVEDEYYNSIRR